jgi:hypothetical protein
MDLNKIFNWKDIKSLSIASIILGFIFSFREWGYESFSLGVGISNWFRYFLLAFILFSIYLISNKQIAKLHGAKVNFKIWDIHRYWFNKSSKFSRLKLFGLKLGNSFKAGIIFPLLFSILSNGFIKFAAIGYNEIEEVGHKRAGKKFKHLTDFEIARIHLAGPFILLLLTIILSYFKGFNNIIEVSKLIIIYSFLPFSKLDGAKILFGSIPLYLFGLIFSITSLLLLNIIPTTALIFLGLLTTIIILLIYLYRAN